MKITAVQIEDTKSKQCGAGSLKVGVESVLVILVTFKMMVADMLRHPWFGFPETEWLADSSVPFILYLISPGAHNLVILDVKLNGNFSL